MKDTLIELGRFALVLLAFVPVALLIIALGV